MSRRDRSLWAGLRGVSACTTRFGWAAALSLGCDPVALASPALPPDPAQWVCPGSDTPPTPEEIRSWCDAHPDRGQPHRFDPPLAPLADLDAKNAGDHAMAEFLNRGTYRELGWLHDRRWRLTGPLVGSAKQTRARVRRDPAQLRSAQSYGVHPAVRIWYSPEVVDWLCAGREGPLPASAILVKEMTGIEEAPLEIDAQGCLAVGEIDAPTSWTLMVKDGGDTHDGWYWAGIARSADADAGEGFRQLGNPPLLDASGFTLPDQVPVDPEHPDPHWYPTGDRGSTGDPDRPKISDIAFPYNMYGNYCVNCHASAERELTYATLGNLLGDGLQYRYFSGVHPEREPRHEPQAASAHDRIVKTSRRRGEGLPRTEPAPSTFPRPLPEPDPEFREYYSQLPAVPFERAWSLRLPAETWDHVPAAAGGADAFLTSDQCIGCHDATVSNAALPHMVLELEEPTPVKLNLSPYGEWRASPMGLAGRDPIFFSQLQSETNHLPELRECIENTCLHCHGVMGQRQLASDTQSADARCQELFAIPPPEGVAFGEPFPLAAVRAWPGEPERGEIPDAARYAALARDGISCAVCHRISDAAGTELGQESSFTGNFVADPADRVNGPYTDVVTKPMEHALGVTPQHADVISDSALCASCHNILLPVIDDDGRVEGHSYEQSTHLEWTNSVFGRDGPGFRSCQDCHMPESWPAPAQVSESPATGPEPDPIPLAFPIANIESSDFAPTDHRLPDAEIELRTRSPYRRHSLHGLNLFLNQMFQQFPMLLGVRQLDYMNGPGYTPPLLTAQESMLRMARRETAHVEIRSVERYADGSLRAQIEVGNWSGHYLPSGVGFRRAFLEFRVRDAAGETLWVSGSTDDLGVIVDTAGAPLPSEQPLQNPGAYQPHHQRIHDDSQVQIYQEVVADSQGEITTSFLRRARELKDNRLRPRGFDPGVFLESESRFIRDLGCLHGEVRSDPHYSDPERTGSDRIEYVVSGVPGAARIEVRLFSQSIPPSYLQERFRDAGVGPAHSSEIERLYHLTSHLRTDGGPIQRWKLELAEARATLPEVAAGDAPPPLEDSREAAQPAFCSP